jgi:hypothetical protein
LSITDPYLIASPYLITGPLSITGPYRGMYSPAGAYPQAPASTDGKTAEVHGDSYKVRYDPIRQEIVLEQDKPCPIRRGDWIVLTAINGKIKIHIDSVEPESRASLCVSHILLCPV